jgi:hypothetical protein
MTADPVLSELLRRLRALEYSSEFYRHDWKDAADTIERLRTALERIERECPYGLHSVIAREALKVCAS